MPCHPNKEGLGPFSTVEEVSLSRLKRKRRHSDVMNRYFTLTSLQAVVEKRTEVRQLLTAALNEAEDLVGLKRSNLLIAWKTPKNLSAVFADSNRKALVTEPIKSHSDG